MAKKEDTYVTVDRAQGTVAVEGKEIKATPKMFKIACALIEAGGAVLSREKLLKDCWGIDEDLGLDTRTVDQHVARLRRAIGKRGLACVVVVREQGYKGRHMAFAGAKDEPVLCAGCQREVKAARATLKSKGIEA